MSVRPWHDEDLGWFWALNRRLDPEVDLDRIRHLVGDDPSMLVRVVALDDAIPVGVAVARSVGEHTQVHLLVDPVARHRGHGSALWAALAPVVAGRTLVARAADDARSTDVARHWGFVEAVPDRPDGWWLVRVNGG